MIDCTIIGGGAAGLQAALTLGRARRETLLLDAGEQNNLATHGIGGLLGFDGRPPAELYAQGRRELARYPGVTVRDERATAVRREGATFVIDDTIRTRTVILATGLDYGMPDIDGLAPLWGDTVFHCPFCHGWELRDKRLGLIQPDDAHAEKLLGILTNWFPDAIRITEPVARLEAEAGKLARVVFEDGSVLEREALLVGPRFRQRTPFAEQLGLELLDWGAIRTEAFAATSVPGVFAAGDAANMPNLQTAISTGAMAASGVIFSLAT